MPAFFLQLLSTHGPHLRLEQELVELQEVLHVPHDELQDESQELQDEQELEVVLQLLEPQREPHGFPGQQQVVMFPNSTSPPAPKNGTHVSSRSDQM